MAILDQKISVAERVSSTLSELVEAERVLVNSWHMYQHWWNELAKVVRDKSDRAESCDVTPGYDEEWICDEPEAQRGLFAVELLVASLLNHVYIVCEQVAVLTRFLETHHSLAVATGMGHAYSKKNWKSKTLEALSRAYHPMTGDCPDRVPGIRELLDTRGGRVHTNHLFAYLERAEDGKFALMFQNRDQLRAHCSDCALTTKQIHDGLADLQCFLHWYVEAIRAA